MSRLLADLLMQTYRFVLPYLSQRHCLATVMADRQLLSVCSSTKRACMTYSSDGLCALQSSTSLNQKEM